MEERLKAINTINRALKRLPTDADRKAVLDFINSSGVTPVVGTTTTR